MSEPTTTRPVSRPAFDARVDALHRAEVFSGEPGSIAQARAVADCFLAELAAEWFAEVGERKRTDLLLTVSELVTNADRYSLGPYLLELEGTAGLITVTVYDSSSALPLLYGQDPQRLGGHGMEIVAALCDRLIAERVPVGKRVRAEFELSG